MKCPKCGNEMDKQIGLYDERVDKSLWVTAYCGVCKDMYSGRLKPNHYDPDEEE